MARGDKLSWRDPNTARWTWEVEPRSFGETVGIKFTSNIYLFKVTRKNNATYSQIPATEWLGICRDTI